MTALNVPPDLTSLEMFAWSGHRLCLCDHPPLQVYGSTRNQDIRIKFVHFTDVRSLRLGRDYMLKWHRHDLL